MAHSQWWDIYSGDEIPYSKLVEGIDRVHLTPSIHEQSRFTQAMKGKLYPLLVPHLSGSQPLDQSSSTTKITIGGPHSRACHAHQYSHWVPIARSCLGLLQINGPGKCRDQVEKLSLYCPNSLHLHISWCMEKGICAWDSPWFSLGRIILISTPPLHHLISEGLIWRLWNSCTYKLHFCSEEGGDSDAGATPPAPLHCSTRGRVVLPQFH